jgi:hypothetical protein
VAKIMAMPSTMPNKTHAHTRRFGGPAGWASIGTPAGAKYGVGKVPCETCMDAGVGNPGCAVGNLISEGAES